MEQMRTISESEQRLRDADGLYATRLLGSPVMFLSSIALPFHLQSFCLIPLTKGLVAKVSPEDYELISQYNWCASKEYAVSRFRIDGKSKIIPMHRFLLDAQPGMEVDHRDSDTLNNQRSNIRLCTHKQNARNVAKHRDGGSRFKGVTWWKRDANWLAQICIGGNQKKLGYFSLEEDAAKAYDDAARQLFGEFARLNFPGPGEIGIDSDHTSEAKDARFLHRRKRRNTVITD